MKRDAGCCVKVGATNIPEASAILRRVVVIEAPGRDGIKAGAVEDGCNNPRHALMAAFYAKPCAMTAKIAGKIAAATSAGRRPVAMRVRRGIRCLKVGIQWRQRRRPVEVANSVWICGATLFQSKCG